MSQTTSTADFTSEMRASVLAQVDRFFFGVLSLTLLASFTGAGLIAAQELPAQPEDSLSELRSGRFGATLLPAPAVPKPATTPSTAAVKPAPVAAPALTHAPEAEAARRPSDAELHRRLGTMGMLGIIGSGAGGLGGLADVLGEAKGAGELARAMDGAQGFQVATVGLDGMGKARGAEAGETATLGAIGTAGVREVKLAEARAVDLHDVVRGGVKEEQLSLDTTELRPEQVSGFVRGRKGAFQQCYERELKRNPKLQGRVVLRFSITPRGRATDIAFEENTLRSPEVTDCIQALMRTWAFPFRPSDDVPVAYPFVFAPTG